MYSLKIFTYGISLSYSSSGLEGQSLLLFVISGKLMVYIALKKAFRLIKGNYVKMSHKSVCTAPSRIAGNLYSYRFLIGCLMTVFSFSGAVLRASLR